MVREFREHCKSNKRLKKIWLKMQKQSGADGGR